MTSAIHDNRLGPSAWNLRLTKSRRKAIPRQVVSVLRLRIAPLTLLDALSELTDLARSARQPEFRREGTHSSTRRCLGRHTVASSSMRNARSLNSCEYLGAITPSLPKNRGTKRSTLQAGVVGVWVGWYWCSTFECWLVRIVVWARGFMRLTCFAVPGGCL